MYVGLPHAHICVRDPNAPPKWNHDAIGDYIDSVISARFPDNMEEWPEYVVTLRKNMVHRCSDGPNGCMPEGKDSCKNHFDTNILREKSCIDDDGFPQYKRLQEKDLVVVAHSIEALMDWGGHINFEYCGSCLTVIYLYKYLFKGSKKEKFRLQNCNDIDDDDEINLHIRGRVLTSMDAVWRTFGFQTYPQSDPTVQSVRVVGPEEMLSLTADDKACDLLVWFCRPLHLQDMKFTELYSHYTRSFTKPNAAHEYFTVLMPNITRPVYLKRRTSKILTRMQMIYISVGEMHYLRTLLIHIVASSYEELKTHNGVLFDTFQEAAYANNIVDDKDECLKCLLENIIFCTPYELRALFAILTSQGFATLNILENIDIVAAMTADFRMKFKTGEVVTDQVYNCMLRDFQQRLAAHGKTMDQFGLPEPAESESEYEMESKRYINEAQQVIYNRLNEQFPNNDEQQEVMDCVMNALAHPGSTEFIFVQGLAGTGKSNLGRKLLSYGRANGHLSFALASTALVATLYDNGWTAHSFFKVEVRDDTDEDDTENRSDVQCILGPTRKELLDKTRLIFWDEFPSNHAEVFNAAYIALNQLQGKIIVAVGDFKQCPPVVQFGSREDIVNASIKSHNLFQQFRKMELTRNMRLEGMERAIQLKIEQNCATDSDILDLEAQKKYGESLLAIGRGITTESVQLLDEDATTGRMLLRLEGFQYFTQEEEVLSFLYPNGLQYPNMIGKHVLVATNYLGDFWNSKIQEQNEEDLVILRSVDTLVDCDDPYGILAGMLTKEVLAKYDHNGVPPHELHLKKGDIALVLVTMSKIDKITKNTRVLILKITQRTVRVQTLTEPQISFSFPRINFKFKLPYGNSFRLLRRQFPLRLAYAISINKSQGMEGDKIVIDGRVSPFMMGHTYVANSRVTSFKNIAILNTPEQILDLAPTIVNVVYKELLTEHDTIDNPEVFKYDISTRSEDIQKQFKLSDAHIFNKLKYKTTSPSEQAKKLIINIPLSRRKEIYKMAMGSDSITSNNHDQARPDRYVNPRTNMASSHHAINDSFTSPADEPNIRIIAMEPRITVSSLLTERQRQLEYNLNLKNFTTEDVPGDGACFFHAVLLELRDQNYCDAFAFTADTIRQRTCDFLSDNRALCMQAGCPYLDLVYNSSMYSSFDDFITTMRHSTSYAEHIIINATHLCYEINIVIIYDVNDYVTNLSNDTYQTTVTLGNLENIHFVRAKRRTTISTFV